MAFFGLSLPPLPGTSSSPLSSRTPAAGLTTKSAEELALEEAARNKVRVPVAPTTGGGAAVKLDGDGAVVGAVHVTPEQIPDPTAMPLIGQAAPSFTQRPVPAADAAATAQFQANMQAALSSRIRG